MSALNQIGADFDGAVVARRADPDHPVAVQHDIGRARVHQKVKPLETAGVGGEKLEKIPLRHERDEFANGRKMGEIRDRQTGRADLNGKAPHFSVWEFQELVQQTQLMHQLEC